MKTTIGILTSGATGRLFDPVITTMASEYFGVIAQEKNDKDNGILWLTFPSKQNAKDFVEVINLNCVDKDKKVFE